MKLKDINLIPDKILYKNQIFLSRVSRIILYTMIGLLLGVILALPVYQRIELQQQVNQLNNALDNASLQVLNDAEIILANKIQEKNDMDKMLKSIAGTDLKTTEIISMVTSKMPAGITAESIMYQPDYSELTLRAVSTGREDIALFLKRLYNEALFAGVNVSEIHSAGTTGLTGGTAGRYSFSVVIKIGRKE